jgi:hypothetical protein
MDPAELAAALAAVEKFNADLQASGAYEVRAFQDPQDA